jgi:hypothetical protein
MEPGLGANKRQAHQISHEFIENQVFFIVSCWYLVESSNFIFYL